MKKPSEELIIMQTLLQNLITQQDKHELLIKEMSKIIDQLKKEIQELKLAITTNDTI